MNEQVAEAPAAAVEAPAEESKTVSLDEHAALYGAQDPALEGEAKKANDEARAKVRHRARSQQASPEDAPRIQELTKRLREVEAENNRLKQPAQSSPVRADSSLGTQAAPAGDVAGSARQAGVQQPTRERPSVDRIGVEGGYDTYEDYVEALADWRYEQNETRRTAQQQQAGQQQAVQQSWNQAHKTYGERLATFKATHADYDTLLEEHGKVNIPAAPYQAILAGEHGPAWVYHLMQHPDQLAELALLFDGKPPSPDMIAHASRWLSSRAKVEPAQAPAPLALAPRPPNPVRTGAARGDDAQLSDDSMSIEAHEKAYGRRRR